MVHAALLLLMLEAVHHGPRFTISLKRSTQNLQLSTRSPADYPIFGQKQTLTFRPEDARFTSESRHSKCRKANAAISFHCPDAK
jgi:hypothetical protein